MIDAGLNVTALRNNFFMNHLLKTDCENIVAEGWFSNPLGDMRNSFVATRDIAEAAAVVLSEGPNLHSNKFYDITGPAPQSMAEIASDLGRAMGKRHRIPRSIYGQFRIRLWRDPRRIL